MRIAVRRLPSARRGTPILLVAIALAGEPAASQDGSDESYLRLFGGATFPQADDFRIATLSASDDGSASSLGADLSFDTGWLVGAALGRRVARRVGVDLEFTYRRVEATADDQARAGHHRNISQTGTAESRALMLNVRYDLAPVGTARDWQPYVGWGSAPPT